MSDYKTIVNPHTKKLQLVLKKSVAVETNWGGITGTLSDQTDLQSALDAKANDSDLTSHENDTNNPHSVDKTDVGLSNVDNTSDVDKPISTATQTALDDKIDEFSALVSAETLMLFNFEGNDGDTSTTDESSNNYSSSFVNSAEIDTAYKKYGNSSIVVPAGSKFTVGTNPDIVPFHKDTTRCLDFFIKFDTTLAFYQSTFIFRQYENSNKEWYMFYDGSNGFYFYVKDSSASYLLNVGATASVMNDQNWHHVALICQSDGNIALYLDGTRTYLGSTSFTSDISIGGTFDVGRSDATGDSGLNMDCLRLSEGNPFGSDVTTESTITVPASAPVATDGTVYDYLVKVTGAGVTERSSIIDQVSGNDNKLSNTDGILKIMNFGTNLVTKTTTYQILLSDTVVICDTTSGAFEVTLPDESTAEGKIYEVKNIGSNTLTVSPYTSGVTIDGDTDQTLSQYESLTLVCDGSNWSIL